MESLNAQILTLTNALSSLELSSSQKLAIINTEHVQELETLQRVHMIRLQILQDERDTLTLQLFSLQDQLDASLSKFAHAQSTASIAKDLAASLQTLRRDSKCEVESFQTKSVLEREARVQEVEKRVQVESEMSFQMSQLKTENANLHKIIEGLRIENELLRSTRAVNPVNRGFHESIGELLETDVSLMEIGI
ncbi:hypothetical protein HDU98_010062 [Podochytrium sp. JEL0797]|nr:hypothetical protein HDU98_010062 [Podochytrium sp. JEL0797]